MLQQDSRSLSGNILGIIGIVLLLFLPIASLAFGIIGFVQSSRQKNDLAKKGRILNLIPIILSVILIAVNIYLYYQGETLLSAVGG